MRTPSAQTLDDLGVREMFQELEEVPRTMVGGLDAHRQQITFDYVDDDGLVHWGQIRSATRIVCELEPIATRVGFRGNADFVHSALGILAVALGRRSRDGASSVHTRR